MFEGGSSQAVTALGLNSMRVVQDSGCYSVCVHIQPVSMCILRLSISQTTPNGLPSNTPGEELQNVGIARVPEKKIQKYVNHN